MENKQRDQYAVIGNPIEHSKSPQIHTAFASATEQNMEYGKILGNDFQQDVATFFQNGGRGLNVTVPFKQDAFEFASQLSQRAQRAGAVNTLTLEADGSITGDNTDGLGLVRDLIKGADHPITGEKILLIGAGGASRGVLQPLLEKLPESIFIANRTAEKAHLLAQQFADLGAVSGGGFDEIPNTAFDIIINASSASISGELPPIPATALSKHTLAYDMMYGPEPTVFLKWAHKTAGCKIQDGLGMLVGQAAASFRIWRGVKPQIKPVIEQLRKA